jgi:hypothetical protein
VKKTQSDYLKSVSIGREKKYREFNFENVYKNIETYEKYAKLKIGGFVVYEDEKESIALRANQNAND